MHKIKVGYYLGDIDPDKNSSQGIFKQSLKLLEFIISEKDLDLSLIIQKQNKRLFRRYKCSKLFLNSPFKKSLFNRLWIEQISLPKIIKENCLDVVIFPRGMVSIIKPKKTAYLSIICDLIPLYYLRKFKIRYLFGFLSLLISFKRSNKIITISEYSRLQISKFTKKEIEVIPSGIPINPEEIKPVKVKINKPFFFIYGNKNPHKNLSLSISLAKEYNKDFGETYGLIYPNGKFTDNEMAYLYKNASACISLSEIEGLGYALIESYSYGTPVVFYNQTSVKEVGNSLPNHIGACDSLNKKEVFSAINDVLNMSNQEILENKKALLKKYNWNNCRREFIKILKKTAREVKPL